ncbi:ABC transporter permease [Niveibacterium microcysteis]|uniref:ABC transporter permease n=1 Tax=Niveibacterium microcysteis TaxID=2811415 RepID=A0ABX7M253_9RHOO|nr:ABC transporter permease [Niveibacterium microcysteis]QSI75228.1 ABC transporter permease [Niveibacterium microcysteis]
MNLVVGLFISSLRRRRFATGLSLIAVMLGVALGVAVSVVNRSALDEFAHGVRVLSGDADLQLVGPRNGFDETIFPRVAISDGLALASPVVEVDVRLPGRDATLRVVGLDLLRSMQVQPALRPEVDASLDAGALLDPDVIYPSPAALQTFALRTGQTITLQAGLQTVSLRVGGTAGGFAPGQVAALMDIAGVQWHLGMLGRLTRIDLRWATDGDTPATRAALQALLPPGLQLVAPVQREMQAADMSRAYRANLTMLAVIALATGAFLVFATQSLSVVRRQSEFALLRALGVTRGQLLGGVLAEGCAVGLVGGLAGVAAGHGLAAIALRTLGGDLGAGYFAGSRPALQFDLAASAVFLLLGLAASALGSWWPARRAANADIAPALRSAHQPLLPPARVHHRVALCLALLALALASAPPLGGLPVGGYLSVACVLACAVVCLPALAHLVTRLLTRWPGLLLGLVRARVAAAPSHAVIAAGGVLASVALSVAMAIMVASFRDSVDAWLGRVLPADLYVRTAQGAVVVGLDSAALQRLAAIPGVARVEPIRHEQIRLGDNSLPVALVARPVPAEGADRVFPMRALRACTGDCIWVSEAMTDLYGWRPGQQVTIPIGESLRRFEVAGIWRDYARQSGAILIDLARYRALTGDQRVNDVAVWAAAGVAPDALRGQVRQVFGPGVEIASAELIRRSSLALFDRTFAVTYALEACAVLIGLFGIAASFAALAAARRREFGMLRHIGVTRGQIGSMLALEGALVAGIGVLGGLLAGAAISVLLIYVVNRQSFHWSMDFAVPGASLALFSVAMLLFAALAARWAGSQAMRLDAVRAVREDA